MFCRWPELIYMPSLACFSEFCSAGLVGFGLGCGLFSRGLGLCLSAASGAAFLLTPVPLSWVFGFARFPAALLLPLPPGAHLPHFPECRFFLDLRPWLLLLPCPSASDLAWRLYCPGAAYQWEMRRRTVDSGSALYTLAPVRRFSLVIAVFPPVPSCFPSPL